MMIDLVIDFINTPIGFICLIFCFFSFLFEFGSSARFILCGK